MKKQKTWYFNLLLVGIFSIFFGRILVLNSLHRDYYQQELDRKTKIIFEGNSAPRGRILDTNGKILVDNIGVHDIVYHKISGISFQEEKNIAKRLLEFQPFPEAGENELKEYFLIAYKEEADELITSEEYSALQERKVTSEELEKRKKERISSERLAQMSVQEKQIARIYLLMNTGYIYQNKILLSDVGDELVAKIEEANIPGVFSDISWKRSYLYGNTLRGIFGNISEGLPKEKAAELLEKGYGYDDIVGISYLEEQYEEELKGQKAQYLVNSDKTLTLIKQASRGNDIVLSIDIDLQLKVEDILKSTFLKAKKMANTEYLKESYILIGDPNTGSIKAMVGQMLLQNGKDYQFQDISTNAIHSSFTAGSIVKGASHSVGYLNGVIDLNKKVRDGCVKLYLVPQKCSYKDLGYIDDITALKTSSNYYQFLTAIRLTGKQYSYNMKLNAAEEEFWKYRSVFGNYGLGTLTGIDLPNEKTGIIGKTISDDLLLNLTIGQYDTYTPVELLQYINTINTNGVRKNLSLLKEVRNAHGDLIKTREMKDLSNVGLEQVYYDRIKEGLRQVLYNGTGAGYVNTRYHAFGKTGTAESFYDSDGDGMVDTKTISSTFAMVAPIENPQYSMVIVTPNVSHYDGVKDYTAPFNRLLSTEITKYLFS